MTQEEETATAFKPKTPAERTNSMSNSSDRVATDRDSSSASPSPSPSKSGRAADETSGTDVHEMSSTDSAGNARGSSGGTSCGLVSTLFPSSCRGRAEAFARRLHRRLTSLGNENDSPERSAETDKPCETSWLRPSSSNRVVTTNISHVLQHQPRHSPESDLFYDLELDEEEENEPGSPAEEATATELARLLVNPEILKANHHDACHCSPSGTNTKTTHPASGHQDCESGCVYVSPIDGTPPDSDCSEMFFDPESSDTERTKSEVFLDPIATSDSEIASNLSSCPIPARVAMNARRTDKTAERMCDDTSESESYSSRRNAPCDNRHRRKELACSSEDSLNRSSQETTSPSHESLWSTFDDSTMSLQDESPSKNSLDSIVPHVCLPKSHSDSELLNDVGALMSGERREEDERCIDEADHVEVMSSEVAGRGKDLVRIENGLCDCAEISISSMGQKSIESVESETASPECTPMEDVIANDASNSNGSACDSTVNIPDILEHSNDAETTEQVAARNEAKLYEDKMRLLLTKLSGNPSTKEDAEASGQGQGQEQGQGEEDLPLEQESQSERVAEEEAEEEEEEERPQRIRRCSSLKTGKTPPGTPGRKKIVRFADVLGLDLAAVRTFMDEIPRIPNSAYNDLIFQKDELFQKDGSPLSVSSAGNAWSDSYLDDGRCGSMSSAAPGKIDRMLMPLFQQPGGMATFLDLVRERGVCLENVLVQDPVTLAIQGTVRVINLDFHKSVHIRYTLNSWRNFSDLQATYVLNSCDGFSDKFSFILYCHTLLIGQRLEFAVRFQCKGTQYWDNNGGANYCFQCLPSSSPTGYIPITTVENSRHTDWSPMFY